MQLKTRKQYKDYVAEVYEVDGYEIRKEVYNNGNKSLRVINTSRGDLPDIYCKDDIDGNVLGFVVQTTSYGTLPLKEIRKLISNLEKAGAVAEFLTEKFADKYEHNKKSTTSNVLFYPKECGFETTWEEIERNKSSLKVGETIECTLKNGKKATFCVAHLNPDGDGHVAFVIKDCIESHRMNSNATNEDGWKATEMREYLNNEIWGLLPDDLKAVIKPRLLKTKSTDLDCRDNLWLLSRMEVFGEQGGGELGDVHFPLFATERDRVKNDEDGVAYYWWLRSPYSQYSSSFCSVYTSGSSYTGPAYASYGVAFGFLI